MDSIENWTGHWGIGKNQRIGQISPTRPFKALAGTDIGFDAAEMLPEVRAIGIDGLPPPAAIGVAGDARIVGAGQLQAHTSPLQDDEGPWHGAPIAIGDLAGINGTVVERGHQGIAIAQVALGHRCRRPPGSWSCQEHQHNQDKGEQASHGVGVAMARMAQ